MIKTRPAGMSGRAHAEALASELRSRDESWKEKAQELQQEVLRLRQEMLIAKVTPGTKSATETAGGLRRFTKNKMSHLVTDLEDVLVFLSTQVHP